LETSRRRLRRLNRRQRKSLRVGEFAETGFEIRIEFIAPLDDKALDSFTNKLLDWASAHRLLIGGLGGRLPLTRTEGFVVRDGRGSPSVEDRHALVDWLRTQPEVASVASGDPVDAWYGCAPLPAAISANHAAENAAG
jgi:uncharacterized protein YggL (DUF469 family)